MGKTKGFMEYVREQPLERQAAERVRDWEEFHPGYAEEKLAQQGARCMDCGIPFCQAGDLLARWGSGCPLQNLIPEWNDLVYRGLWEQAYRRLVQTNPFPEFTGRVCPAPCEGSCTLGAIEPPVTIKGIEAAIIDKAFEQGWVRAAVPEMDTGRQVAVVGSGPAGLACASYLNRCGHHVTVYERDDRPGGLLMYGIPNMKLDKQIVQRRLDMLSEEGIDFVTNVQVGTDLAVDELRWKYDALVLCCGATKARDLAVPGRAGGGIHLAMDFLKRSTASLLDSGLQDGRYISAHSKDVVVIGGGDTGTDCAATALRHGCRSVTQLEITPRLPAARLEDNPWPQWPRIHRVDYGHEEAEAVFGQDPRRYSIMTTGFVLNQQGDVTGVECVDVEWEQNGDGRRVPQKQPNSSQVLPADLVLLAMGFTGPEADLLEQLGVDCTESGTVKANTADYKTNLPGVFAAGDIRRGQSLVVWALHEGQQAARTCERYLASL